MPGNLIIDSEVSHTYEANWYFGLCCEKLKGSLVMHSPKFCLSNSNPHFHSLLFPLTGPHSPVLCLSNYTNGPQQLFSPHPSTSCVTALHAGSPTRTISPLLGRHETLHLCCPLSHWMGVKYAKNFPTALIAFQHWQFAAFSHARNLRRPRRHSLVFPQLQLVSETLLPTSVCVVLCLGSNMHLQPWLHHFPSLVTLAFVSC